VVFAALTIILSLFIGIYLNYNYNQPLKNVLKTQVDDFSRLDLGYSQKLEEQLLFGETWKEMHYLHPLQMCVSLPLL